MQRVFRSSDARRACVRLAEINRLRAGFFQQSSRDLRWRLFSTACRAPMRW
jgi:hypothetical protein